MHTTVNSPSRGTREGAGGRETLRAPALALILSGCSLIVPGNDGLNPDLDDDAGEDADAGRDAGRREDAGTDSGVQCGELAYCGGGCVDTRSDVGHCGGCDRPCDTDWVCNDGACFDPVIDVALGSGHACALRASGGVWCWGTNEQGQLGDGTFVDNPFPQRVLDIDDAQSIASAGYPIGGFPGVNCAVRASGEAWCWGSNESGQLGDGTREPRNRPVRVETLVGTLEVGVGRVYSCAVRAMYPHVVCWGSVILADGSGRTLEPVPDPVLGFSTVDIVGLSVSVSHACVVDVDRHVWCWGENDTGALGDGTMTPRGVARVVPGLENIVEVVTSWQQTCAREESGQVWCWGALPTFGEPVLSPQPVASLANATQLFGGSLGATMCALRVDGSLWCWGANHSETVRTGSMVWDVDPLEYTTASDTAVADSSFAFICAVRGPGDLYCWGGNSDGRLGDGTMMDRIDPTPVLIP